MARHAVVRRSIGVPAAPLAQSGKLIVECRDVERVVRRAVASFDAERRRLAATRSVYLVDLERWPYRRAGGESLRNASGL
ncbi:MAG: hypothetical protein JOZ81_09935 [Chloroflexi bacterium]|nr:hypothetical protein [Chloroflexota bacterium]